MAAKLVQIQINGGLVYSKLSEALRAYTHMGDAAYKINFAFRLDDGRLKSITLRDTGADVVAYGSFAELGGFLQYAAEVLKREVPR